MEVKANTQKVYLNYRLKKSISIPIFNYYHDLFYTLNPCEAPGKYVKRAVGGVRTNLLLLLL